MQPLTSEIILNALRNVTDTADGRDVVSAGLISGVVVREGKVGFLITIAPEDKDRKAWLQGACEKAVLAIPGVESVSAVLTAETHPTANNNPAATKKAVWNTNPLPHVKRVIAVASGKGGVGKSTTAVNLAHAFVQLGKRVGLLDADIYGPSLPRMMGLHGKPETKENQIIPLIAHGIACMSMGFLVGENSALVWRGPQMSKALNQMLRGVLWASETAPLDVLLIDMPPGTGDIHLSLVQQAPVNGAVIVTTPQDVAVSDAHKCIDMFRKVNVPILGVIENMSGFFDAESGKHHPIFGEGGGKRLADVNKVALLGEVPIDIALRIASDKGTAYADPNGLYRAIAAKI